MENSNNTGMIVGAIVVLVLLVGGIFWLMNEDDADTDTTQTDTTQTETVQTESDIVALASDTDSLSTLVTAVEAAELVETLQGEGPYTVFAPTNDAFAALPDGTLDSLLEPDNQDQLVGILTYHVVSGEVMSTDLSDGQVVETLNGGTLTVEINDDGVFLVDATDGRAQVTTPDVDASNGVVHIIDSVLLPQ